MSSSWKVMEMWLNIFLFKGASLFIWWLNQYSSIMLSKAWFPCKQTLKASCTGCFALKHIMKCLLRFSWGQLMSNYQLFVFISLYVCFWSKSNSSLTFCSKAWFYEEHFPYHRLHHFELVVHPLIATYAINLLPFKWCYYQNLFPGFKPICTQYVEISCTSPSVFIRKLSAKLIKNKLD